MSKFTRISPPSNNLHEKYSTPPSFVFTNNQHAMYFAKGSSALYDGETKKKRNMLHSDGHGLQIFRNWNQRWSTEELALGDHRGQELILSLETWKGLYEQRWNIYKLL
ncbi:hypothetical protein P5V15_015789 [Pogonomyrmex californicus]